ncbi:MAG: CrcB family protein [Actinomycetota bacterium]
MRFLLVVVGAGIGAPSRFLIDQLLRSVFRYPIGIGIINVFGSFILGLSFGASENTHALIGIGFAGAFTTWSTFILDLYLAYELKKYKETALNLLFSITLGISAAWIGIQLVS